MFSISKADTLLAFNLLEDKHRDISDYPVRFSYEIIDDTGKVVTDTHLGGLTTIGTDENNKFVTLICIRFPELHAYAMNSTHDVFEDCEYFDGNLIVQSVTILCHELNHARDRKLAKDGDVRRAMEFIVTNSNRDFYGINMRTIS